MMLSLAFCFYQETAMREGQMTAKLKNIEYGNWQEWLKTGLLLGMAIYFLALIFTGKLSNYINLRFAWLSYVAVMVFLLLGLWNGFRLFTSRYRFLSHSNAHLPLSWGGIFLMSLPLFFAVLLPSEPLGADAISGTISLEPIGGVSAEARYDLPPLERNVLDWLRAFDQASNPAELNALPVDIVAFVYREPAMSANQFMAARFTLSCCVADAMAIGMPVEAENAQDFADGQWLRIQGSLQAGEFRGETVPVIIPSSIEAVEPPENPYLYS
jgi:putative membrane protein